MEYFGLTTDAYRGLLLKPVGKGPVARTRHRWEDNKKKRIFIKQYEVSDCIDLAQCMVSGRFLRRR
jgi:hypothetical protein